MNRHSGHGDNDGSEHWTIDSDRHIDPLTGQFSNQEITISRKGKIRVFVADNLSNFGIRHGGTETLFKLFNIATWSTAVVMIATVLWLGSADYGITTKSIIGSCLLGSPLLMVLMSILLYCKLRVTLTFVVLPIAGFLGLLVSLYHLA